MFDKFKVTTGDALGQYAFVLSRGKKSRPKDI